MTQVTTTQNVSIANYMNSPSISKWLEETLQDNKSEFVSNMIALTDASPTLAQCDPNKLIKCAMNATALNLPLNKNLGFAYVIPYKTGGQFIPQFQIGYKGLIQLAIRTEKYKTITACEVREGEMKRNKFTGEMKLLGDKPENKVVGYMAYLKLNSGLESSFYMTVEQIEAHAKKFSKAYQYDVKQNKRTSIWSDPDQRDTMAIKTVLKKLLSTYGVLSTELTNAMQHDTDHEATRTTGRGNFEDAEEIPNQGEPENEEEPKIIEI
jgi:recombination protein RecT